MKRIAIDLNDVIRSYTEKFKEEFNKDFPTKKVSEDFKPETNDYIMEFGFTDVDDYNNFLYYDKPFELYGCSDVMDKQLQFRMHTWLSNDIRNVLDEDGNTNEPEIIIVSTKEFNLTIQATLFFLQKIACRVREYYFPKDSLTIWDKCDILITANPDLIEAKPEGKTSVKINSSYNKNVKSDYEYDSFIELMNLGTNEIEKIINKK